MFKLFDRLRKEKPDFVSYIKIIEGNVEDKSLCLSSRDRDWVIENVNFVFHCAAAVKFNLPLQEATKINVRGTESVLELSKEMKNLKVTNLYFQKCKTFLKYNTFYL